MWRRIWLLTSSAALSTGAAGDVGRAAGVGACVEGRKVGIATVDDDLIQGTPSVSAAIWARTVSEPVPRSVAPTRRLKEPSSLSLILAAPMSSPAMPVPCIQIARPIPAADMRPGGRRFPIGVIAPVPADGRGPGLDTLCQTAALNRLRETLAPLSHRYRHRQRLPLFHPVDAP